jgi:putative ABC transport system permease protein
VYVLRNLVRNPLRSAFTCAAVALPIMIFVLSFAVIDGIERFLDNAAQQLRLAVTNRISIVNPLPIGYRAKIESLDPQRSRLTGVCAVRWIGGRIENDKRPLSTLAVDTDTYPIVFPEFLTDPAERAAWDRNPAAIVIGRQTAGQFNWKPGDRVTLLLSVPPYIPMEFHVVSIRSAVGADPIANWCRLDYVNETSRQSGMRDDWVSFIFVKCRSREALRWLRQEVDALFERTPDETYTQDEKSFLNQFITQRFDLPRNLTYLAAVTVFVAMTAAANTMSMNFRDRLGELATLKALGFPGSAILAMVQVESLGLCLFAGLCGAGLTLAAFTWTPLKDLRVPLIEVLEVRPLVCLQGLLVALLVGLAAGAWPAWQAVRLRVVDALRRLE